MLRRGGRGLICRLGRVPTCREGGPELQEDALRICYHAGHNNQARDVTRLNRRRVLRRALSRSFGGAIRRLRRPLLLIAGVLALSTALGVGAFAASGFYGQYGAPRTPVSVQSWAERPVTYLATDCRGCHSAPAAESANAEHARLICESCHVPSSDHPGPVAGVVQMLPAATNEQCVTCHARTAGRPDEVAQVVLDLHYSGAECLACHDSHTSVAVKPREVTHPLDRLPWCSVCHAPMALKEFPANHEVAPDPVCLACHRPGASGQ